MSLPSEADLQNVKLYCGRKYDFLYYDKKTKIENTKEGRTNMKFYEIYKNKVLFEKPNGRFVDLKYGINQDSNNDYIIVRLSESELNDNPSVNESNSSGGGRRRKTRKQRRKIF